MQALSKIVRTAALAVLAAAAPLAALAQPEPGGAYLVAAAGRTQYDYDCRFLTACDNARTTAAKFGGGYRFGIFAVEAWWIDFGNADLGRTRDSLRLRAAAITGAWTLRLAPAVEGVLRAGAADVRHERSGDRSRSSLNATFGLGLVVEFAPAVALEVAWDITGADGNETGSTTANALTAGLRLRF